MLPFAETVLCWRLARGMTQADLARASGVPRPNLSAIERGEREVTLKSLRALALALDVRPGMLVDGEAPNTAKRPMGRPALERIARAAARGTALADPREAALTRGLRDTMASRIATSPGADGLRRVQPRARTRTADRAYLYLRSAEPGEAVASLIERTGGHLAGK